MKKKILALCLVVVLAVTAVTGATLAYFTETEQQTNEFTVGDLAIDLWEDAKHTNGLDEVIKKETELGKDVDTNPGFKYENIMPGDTMEKIVTVENESNYDAYIALVIKQENYYNYNMNVDEYYENGEFKYNAEQMQGVTDDVFLNWNLLYDKTQVASPNAQVRYTMDVLPTSDTGAEVLGVGYAQENADMSGVPQYHYSGAYFTNGVGLKAVPDEEPDFFTISDNGAHDRVWIIYLMVPANDSFTMDLTTVCPDYFDNNSVKAFADMKLDVKAFAIQAKGLAEKEAFAEALKPGFGF